MLNEPDIARSLRSALPLPDRSAPSRDLWPLILERDRRRRWSAVDSGVAAVIVVALLVFPEWVWFLLYHL
jgi:hypothetical protein